MMGAENMVIVINELIKRGGRCLQTGEVVGKIGHGQVDVPFIALGNSSPQIVHRRASCAHDVFLPGLMSAVKIVAFLVQTIEKTDVRKKPKLLPVLIDVPMID